VPPPAREILPLRVTGRVVDGADRPLSGARITSWSNTTATGVSDASGTFDMAVPVAAQDRWFWITVDKPGFETSELMRSVHTAGSTSLRLHQIRNIDAGDTLRSIVSPDDSACGYHWGFICRRVRIRSSSSGSLTLEVSGVAELGMPVGPVGFPQTLESRMSVPVSAGSEVSIDVAAGWPLGAPAEFTLTTSLTPAR
jgi:hypothetical protein